MKLPALLIAFLAASPSVPAQESTPLKTPTPLTPYYTVRSVPLPPGVAPEIGGLVDLPDDRLAVCFHHGEVGILDTRTGAWRIFAEGLHEPLGILAEKDGSLLVMQRPELTRLRDIDADGIADRYDTVWDGFGLTGNYHEFAFGPVRGPDGMLYVSLNLASDGDSIREEVRGEFSEVGVPRAKFYTEWNRVKKDVGRMYSRVPWRGWVMQLDPKDGSATPFACGFRSPNGIGFDDAGNLLVDDNQGDWRGTNELFVVEKGGFYGHPASLVWQKGWDRGVPIKLPLETLNEMRTPPAVCFPYGTYANSPTAFVVIPKTPAWGPFGGQTLVGEMNSPRVLRVLLEKVGGTWQGACVALADDESLKRGLHRLAFVGDTLYLGRTHLSWAGGEGLGSLTPTGKIPFDPLDMHITARGFRLDFTKALAPGAADPELWKAKRFFYQYHETYGSPEMEKTNVVPTKVTLSKEGRTVELEFDELHLGFIYDFDLRQVRSANDEALLNPKIAYTVRRLPAE